jgi:hypothetical protein
MHFKNTPFHPPLPSSDRPGTTVYHSVLMNQLFDIFLRYDSTPRRKALRLSPWGGVTFGLPLLPWLGILVATQRPNTVFLVFFTDFRSAASLYLPGGDGCFVSSRLWAPATSGASVVSSDLSSYRVHQVVSTLSSSLVVFPLTSRSSGNITVTLFPVKRVFGIRVAKYRRDPLLH